MSITFRKGGPHSFRPAINQNWAMAPSLDIFQSASVPIIPYCLPDSGAKWQLPSCCCFPFSSIKRERKHFCMPQITSLSFRLHVWPHRHLNLLSPSGRSYSLRTLGKLELFECSKISNYSDTQYLRQSKRWKKCPGFSASPTLQSSVFSFIESISLATLAGKPVIKGSWKI